jgi:DNA-binding LacI/PurR family transcriptional regulator
VTIDHVFENRIAIVSDNVNGVDALVRYIYSKGHRKIAYLHGENSSVTRSRLAGFRKACEELGLEIPEEYVLPCVYHDPDLCEAQTRKLMDLPEPPTCIIFPDDFSFLGGYNVLRERGMRIPENISAVGYDGIALAQAMRLTTYSQNTQDIGRTATEKLISLIEHPKTTPIERILVPGALMEGITVKQI